MMQLVQEDSHSHGRKSIFKANDEIHEKYMLMVPVIEKAEMYCYMEILGYVDVVELF